MHHVDVPATLGASMSRSRVVPWIFVAFGPWIAAPAVASAIASSDLAVSGVSIVVDGRTIVLDDVWTLEAFASTNDTLGGSDSDFDTGTSPGTSTATALIALASASGSAVAPGNPADFAVTGHAASDAQLLGCGSTAAFASPFGQLSNFFSISGSGEVDAAFAADLVLLLNADSESRASTSESRAVPEPATPLALLAAAMALAWLRRPRAASR
jgi:hypothetical protein